MQAPASASPADNISMQEWTWVQNLIQEVQRQEMCDAFAKSLWQWDMCVQQFRKVESEHIILGTPTKTDLQCQAICLHALLAIGKLLHLEANKLADSELAKFGITREQIDAYVAELELSLREWHHAIPESELKALREKIFGGTA